ncbi:MAG: GSU2403 family nucleotidyltransferase fold protein [Acidobacteriota bacterium]
MDDLRNVLKESKEFYKDQKKTLIARISILPKGNIKKKIIKDKTYYYLQYRKGSKVMQEYLGKIIPDKLKEDLALRKQLQEELEKVNESLKLLNDKHSLSSSFFPPLEKILSKMTQMELWDSGIEIIGSWCFIIYQKYLPVEKYPLRTQDLDILIPIPYKGNIFDFSSYLKELGFEEQFNPNGSTFYSAGSIKVEFIAPGKGKRNISRNLKELSVNPQYLHYVETLLQNSIEIKISKGIKVNLPAPSSFLLHKLLIAILAERKDKMEKDIRQAIYIGKYVLKEKRERAQLISSWETFSKSWKNKTKKSLEAALKIIPLERNTINELKKVLD